MESMGVPASSSMVHLSSGTTAGLVGFDAGVDDGNGTGSDA